jgi:hypothetical protein
MHATNIQARMISSMPEKIVIITTANTTAMVIANLLLDIEIMHQLSLFVYDIFIKIERGFLEIIIMVLLL